MHHLGSVLILSLYTMVPGFVPQVGFYCFFVRTGFYTSDKKPFPANFVSQNQKAACLEPSGWSNMKYYLTGLLLGKDLFSWALSPVPKLLPLWNILKPFLSAFCPLLEDWALNHYRGLFFISTELLGLASRILWERGSL